MKSNLISASVLLAALTVPVAAHSSGALDDTIIGAITRAPASFTTLTANGATTLTANTASTSPTTGTLVVTGGVGVSGAVNAGDNISANTITIGTTTPVEALTLQGDSAKYILQRIFSNDTESDRLVFDKARGTSSSAIKVNQGDIFGLINFRGYDGANFLSGSVIAATADNTTGTNDMPGRLLFYTTADGASAGTLRMSIDNAGAVTFPTIGTTASSANAFLNSGASNSLLRSTSSARYKKNIEDLTTEQADEILQLRPITYQSKAPVDDPSLRWWGFIAEEVAKIEPRLVQWSYRDEDYKFSEHGVREPKKGAELVPDGVQYERLTVGLVALVKRQQEQINALQERLDKLTLPQR